MHGVQRTNAPGGSKLYAAQPATDLGHARMHAQKHKHTHAHMHGVPDRSLHAIHACPPPHAVRAQYMRYMPRPCEYCAP